MYRIKAKNIQALAANALVEDLQHYFLYRLEKLSNPNSFKPVTWLRNQGEQGGGVRYVSTDTKTFNRASINISQIQYEQDKTRSLASATALSAIIHPENPYAPSIHMHISWTEMKNGKAYWRIMADLNPAIKQEKTKQHFTQTLQQVAGKQYLLASQQGDQYFYIPALDKYRGVSHFYLEEYNSGNPQGDFDLANQLGRSVIDCYQDILDLIIKQYTHPTPEDYQQQLSYHTLYLFQVLTLDRGTTSGLLIHNQNDLGIMGSLPAQVDKALLINWLPLLPTPQNQLLENIINTLPEETPCPINDKIKLTLAEVLRKHYQQYPQALAMQAKGNITPTTVEQHQS